MDSGQTLLMSCYAGSNPVERTNRGTMKLSRKFQDALGRYVEWSKCTTPMESFPHGQRNLKNSQDLILERFLSGDEGHILPYGGKSTPEEIIFERETFGKVSASDCTDWDLLAKYDKGKANRDWWSKEKGWWDKNAAYVPEEFLSHLTDECFFELFGRWPIPEKVRFIYDNKYTWLDFRLDFWIKSRMYFGKLVGYDRDYRKPWYNIIVTVILKRKIDALVWRLKTFTS
jgi:hypothetical protein